MPFCCCWGERSRGGSQTPWLCSITHESQVPHGGCRNVGQGHQPWARDMSDLDSQPDSVTKPGLPVGFLGHVSTQQLEMCCLETLPCLQSPMPVPALGTLAPVVLLGQVGWQRTCPPWQWDCPALLPFTPHSCTPGPVRGAHTA